VGSFIIEMSKKKKSAVLIESDSDDSDSGKDLEEVPYCIPRPNTIQCCFLHT